jgi:putative membrane protein
MTTNTITFNQPLFFELDAVENIAEEEAKVTLSYTPPVILPDEIDLETNELLEAHEPEPQPANTAPPVSAAISPNHFEFGSHFSPWLWLAGSLGTLLVFVLLIDTYQFVVQYYTSSWFLGTLILILIALITGSVFLLIWRAYQQLKTLRTVSHLQQEGRQIVENNEHGHALAYLTRIAAFYSHRPVVKTRIDHFYITLTDSYNDRESCALFSQQIMKDIDQQAYGIVTQRAKETALMVMISQLAILDTILTLWRNVRMIRDIATLYGGKPGLFGSFTLVTMVAQNLIYADVSEAVADSVAEILGGSMLSFMSAQAAQGLGSGVLTARVGLHAMQVCRPLPFLETEKPRLKDIRREIVKSMKSVFETREKKNKK